MKTKVMKTPLDEPFDFKLVNNVSLIPIIEALRFKLTIRALYRAGFVDHGVICARYALLAILMGDPLAADMALTFPGVPNARLRALPFNCPLFGYELRLFAIENLVKPGYYRQFERKVRWLIDCGTHGVTPHSILKEISRKARPNMPKADARFYALYWILDHPGEAHVFDWGKTKSRHPVSRKLWMTLRRWPSIRNQRRQGA